MITADDLWRCSDQRSNAGVLAQAVKDRRHAASATLEKDVIFALGNDFLTPALKLLLSGYDLTGAKITTNYEPTEAERETIRLRNAGIDQHDEGDQKRRASIRMDPGSVGGPDRHYYHVIEPGYGQRTKGRLQALFEGEFPLPDGPGPGIDLQREHDVAENKKGNGIHTVHRVYLAAAFALLGAKTSGRNAVACLIVDPTGRIISWGQKSPAYPTLHAETSALLRYGRKLPRGARVYTTLSPCKMCGAWIKSQSEDNQVIAYYGSMDNTALAGKSALAANARPVRQIPEPGTPQLAGPKPLDLDREGKLGARGSDLGERVIEGRRSDTGVIEHLSDDRRVKMMREGASRFFKAKQQKYAKQPTDGKILNRNVAAAMTHVMAFLAHNRVQP